MALLCCSDIQCVMAPCPCTNSPFLSRISRLLQSKVSVHIQCTCNRYFGTLNNKINLREKKRYKEREKEY